MTQNYTTKSTSRNTANVDDIVIRQTSTTRLILRAQIVENNPKDPRAGVRAAIIHQRKAKDNWEDISGKALSSLKAGDMQALQLDSETTLKLFGELQGLYALHGDVGVSYGKKEYVVGTSDEIVKLDPQHAEIIKTLIRQGHSEKVWKELIDADPDLATRLSITRVHQSRLAALAQFTDMIGKQHTEPEWQDFFEKNTWIFGYGLNYQILRAVSSQPTYGGQAVGGKGTNKGDFLTATGATINFTVLVEIKAPHTDLLEKKPYRNDTYAPGSDVIGGVTQLRANALQWETQGSRTDANRDQLESKSIFTVQPKKILVTGDTSQLLNDRARRNSFELFRRNQSDVEILTFDELLIRAKFILDHSE